VKATNWHDAYRKNLNNWTVCYEVQNSLLWKGGKDTAKTRPLSPLRDRKKKKKFLDLTRRGKSNDIAHRPIIQVFTVSKWFGIEIVKWNITIVTI